jgi:hypothetical protein
MPIKGVKNDQLKIPNGNSLNDSVGSFNSVNEVFLPNPEQSQEIITKFKSIIDTRLDKLYDTRGADGEMYAYGIAVNQVKKKAEQPEETPPTEDNMDKDQKLKEMIQAALSKPLTEKKKSFPDLTGDGKVTQADILKAKGVELDESNLYSGEEWSVEPEGRFWIVTYRTMNGNKEKVFQSEDEARKFASTLNEDLDLGHKDNEPHMIKAELAQIGKYAMELYKMVDQFEGSQEVDFPAWWQSKITTAKNMISSAKHYLEFELEEPQIDAMVGVASEEGAIEESLAKSANILARSSKDVDEFKKKWYEKYKSKQNDKTEERLENIFNSVKKSSGIIEEMTPEKSEKIGMPFKDIAKAVLAKLKESKGEYAQIEKAIANLKSKGKNAGDTEMQKLIKRRAELEKSKK